MCLAMNPELARFLTYSTPRLQQRAEIPAFQESLEDGLAADLRHWPTSSQASNQILSTAPVKVLAFNMQTLQQWERHGENNKALFGDLPAARTLRQSPAVAACSAHRQTPFSCTRPARCQTENLRCGMQLVRKRIPSLTASCSTLAGLGSQANGLLSTGNVGTGSRSNNVNCGHDLELQICTAHTHMHQLKEGQAMSPSA